MKARGFTLTETLVVLAIIAVLAGVLYPVGRSLLGRSREAACIGNLRSLGTALQTYLQEHNDRMPEMVAGRASKTEDVPVLETVLLPYVESAEAFRCPADHVHFRKSGSSYLWNSTQSGRHVSQLAFFGIRDRPDRIPLITDKEPCHPNGTNFLHADQTATNRPRFAAGH